MNLLQSDGGYIGQMTFDRFQCIQILVSFIVHIEFRRNLSDSFEVYLIFYRSETSLFLPADK